MLNHSLPAWATDPPFSLESVVAITHEQNIICSKALVYWQLFAGHVVSSRSMKRKEKKHRIIVGIRWIVIVCWIKLTYRWTTGAKYTFFVCLFVLILPDAAFPIPFCELLYTFKLDLLDNSFFVALASYCLVADWIRTCNWSVMGSHANCFRVLSPWSLRLFKLPHMRTRLWRENGDLFFNFSANLGERLPIVFNWWLSVIGFCVDWVCRAIIAFNRGERKPNFESSSLSFASSVCSARLHRKISTRTRKLSPRS